MLYSDIVLHAKTIGLINFIFVINVLQFLGFIKLPINPNYLLNIEKIKLSATMDKNYKVSCFGAGFVGLPTSSVLAFHNPTIKVTFPIISVCCL
jgi:hypothetical protein